MLFYAVTINRLPFGGRGSIVGRTVIASIVSRQHRSLSGLLELIDDTIHLEEEGLVTFERECYVFEDHDFEEFVRLLPSPVLEFECLLN